MNDSVLVPASRKWQALRAAETARTVWAQITRSQRVRRSQWERELGQAVDTLTAIAVTAEDEWSRSVAQTAVKDIAWRTRQWR